MTEQQPLWAETLNAAIEALIDAAGGAKRVGCELWPEIADPEDARRRITHCLSPKRREQFDSDDLRTLLRIGRRINCHILMDFLSGDAGYEAPAPKRLDVEIERISANVARLHNEAQRQIDQLARLQNLIGEKPGA